MDRFPTTPAGKVDRAAFAPPDDRSGAGADDYVAPRDDVERLLCSIWSEVLRVERVGIDDDFFARGGHSLLAARLIARIDEEFGRALSLGILFATPTVRKLAEFLRAAKPVDGCVSLVPITAGSSRPPVFAVPGVGGNVLGFADLARALGTDQAFYGLQSVGLDGVREPLESIEDMARLYVAEVRSVRPHGPYAFVGACFGATVACEMARQTIRSGEDVAFLGLLDPTSMGGEDAGRPSHAPPRVLKQARVAGSFLRGRLELYRSELSGLGRRQRLAYVARKLRTLLSRIRGRGSLEGVRLEMTLMKVHDANVAALRHYERRPFDGRVGVLAIYETARRAQAREFAEWWSALGTQVERQTIPGSDSGDMLIGGNAQALAAELARHLRNAFDRK